MRYPLVIKVGNGTSPSYLVGGATPLKILKVNGKDDIPHIMAKNMFETTSQL